jgi:hypothetical protein
VLLAEGLIHRELQLSIVIHLSQSHVPQLIGIGSNPYPFVVIPARLSRSIRTLLRFLCHIHDHLTTCLYLVACLFCSFVKPHTLHAHCDLE